MKPSALFTLCFLLIQPFVYASTDDMSEIRYRKSVKILSSDAFEGRKPATEGGRKTVTYIEQQFRQAGLKPGNKQSYLQAVHLAGLTTTQAEISVTGNKSTATLQHTHDILTFARHISPQLSVTESEIVFVGHGVVSPEYNWNDYQGIDVAGKTVIILANDPGYLSGDKTHFLGRGTTYYAKDSYKYEEAERQGAAAALIIHDRKLTKSSWDEQVATLNKERLVLDVTPEENASVLIQGYLSEALSIRLMSDAGYNYANERKSAQLQTFQPKSLKYNISLTIETSISRSVSHNVMGLIPGSERPDEYIIYMAHWDHLGRDSTLEGDQIYNGARDNAAGIASLIELAHLYQSNRDTKRSVLIMAVTAEESGLLGSYFYTKKPVYPLRNTVGVINLDMMNVYGATQDVLVHGLNDSGLMDKAINTAVTKIQGRTVKPFGRLEAGIAYRNDGFSFNRAGVPTIGLASGGEHIRHGANWMEAQANSYFSKRYHQPADEYTDEMDFSGALLDTASLYLIGRELANSSEFAHWYNGKEFKHLRDAQLHADNVSRAKQAKKTQILR